MNKVCHCECSEVIQIESVILSYMRRIESIFLLILLLFFPLLISAAPIHISKNKIIQRTISLTPGFAAMIQFPQDIMSMDLADPSIVHCERSSVDPKSALCKPKVYDRHSTNLIVTCESNKFNLTLTVDPNKNKPTNIISFEHVKAKEPKLATIIEPKCPNITDNLIDKMITGFKIVNFSRTSRNEFAKLKTDKVMFFGDHVYITFDLKNNNYASYEVLRVDVYLEKLGGMTGMSIRSERLLPTDYRLISHTISSGNSVLGIVKFKNMILEENQALSLRITEKTDKRKDLYFKFNLGV